MKEVHDQPGSLWRDGFLFLGNQLALDFLNTNPVMSGGPVELLPDLDTLLRWFQAAGLINGNDVARLRRKFGGTEAADRLLRSLRAWRDRFRSAVVAWEADKKVAKSFVLELNRLMAKHPMLTRLTFKGENFTTESWFPPETPEGLIPPLVHSAAMLLATADRSRVRMCSNCVLHFLDTSKKGTRRWCSMELCGNRIKVAAYAARQRKSGC